ncbi:MAG TPA: hypothetical protein ENJ95_08860 [Bacteroidetes bacterium]|nr:hypothetical protein [Bacteroidota bacterium]
MLNKLGKYSFGIGDRFAHQGVYQLKPFQAAKKFGTDITPVWNKSHREHITVGSKPESVKEEAEQAIKKCGWEQGYMIDADHINLQNVDGFLASSDFFTIDVAYGIGQPCGENKIQQFIEFNKPYIGGFSVPGSDKIFNLNKNMLREFAGQFLTAIYEAQRIYQYILEKKGEGNFVAEISMDEVDKAQSPVELFLVCSGLAMLGVRPVTIAPKFTGRFNKGVDYEGDLNIFAKEFEENLLVIKYATEIFDLPKGLKLSVHTGSDKFSLYPVINQLIKKHNIGLHLKTAGTTWLEEVIGLAEAGGSALELVKGIYVEALNRFDELTGPYSTVLNIDKKQLPEKDTVEKWDSEKFVNSLRHIPDHPDYNPGFRQLIHTAYKVAAERGELFTGALEAHSAVIGKNVSENILERHIKPLFL